MSNISQKNVLFYLQVFIFLACEPLVSFSQEVDISSSASSTIVGYPVTISKSFDVDLGTIVMVFRIEVVPAGSMPTAGGVIFPVNNGKLTVASFHITGDSYSFSLEQPAPTLTVGEDSAIKTVATFKSDGALTSELNRLPEIFVAVTPKNVTLNYN
ncbi:MAG: hypothetical protein WCL00_06225 [Bacteroidota bacterium]